MDRSDPFPTSPLRPTDLVAEELLHVVLRLERAPWPESQGTYAAGLLALAIRCDFAPAKAEVYRWFTREAGGSLVAHGESHRANLRDAFHEAVAIIPELLLRYRAGLDPGRRPNLRSMLVKWIHWRAGDLYEAEQRYAGRRSTRPIDERAAPATAEAAVELREVLALLDGAAPHLRALRLVGLGHSIAEAARLTGVSRQHIYRMRDALWWAHRGFEAPRRRQGRGPRSVVRRRWFGPDGGGPDEEGQ